MTPTCKVCLRACQSTQPEVIQVSMYSVGPGALLLPPGWDASPSQCYPPPPHPTHTHLHFRVKRGTVGVKVFCSRTKHIDPAKS